MLAVIPVSLFVNGEAVALADLTARSMNFSQHWRTPDLQTATYQLTAPRSAFAEFYNRLEADLRQWAKDDDDLPEFVEELVLRGWPVAAEVVADDHLLEELLLFYDLDLAHALFGQPDAVAVRWVVNSIEDIALTETEVVITGQVGNAALRTAYQDY